MEMISPSYSRQAFSSSLAAYNAYIRQHSSLSLFGYRFSASLRFRMGSSTIFRLILASSRATISLISRRFSLSFTPSSSSTVMPNSSASSGSTEISGHVAPVSQRLTAWGDTPAYSASCSCVRSFLLRHIFNISLNFAITLHLLDVFHFHPQNSKVIARIPAIISIVKVNKSENYRPWQNSAAAP